MSAHEELHDIAERLAFLIADTRKLIRTKRADQTHVVPVVERTRLENRIKAWETDLTLLLRMRDRVGKW